jgi:type III secretory pathway component EscT
MLRVESRKMAGATELIAALSALFGADFHAWALAWARVLPVLILVPAFGLSAVALPIRVLFAATLAVAIAPAISVVPLEPAPFLVALGRETLRGVPLALATSALLWAAIMAGGLADNLRGGRETADLPLFDEPLPAFSVLFGMLVALAFLESGGAERLALALAAPRSDITFAVAVERLVQAVSLAVAIAAPLLAGSVLLEIAGAFVARAAAPAYVLPLLAPLRSLGVLCICLFALERVVELLVILAASAV